MEIEVFEVMVSRCNTRRGRIGRREDGLLQVVTETLRPEDEECLAYWVNDFPPSGLLDDIELARDTLRRKLGVDAANYDCVKHSIKTGVGPWQEPELLE